MQSEFQSIVEEATSRCQNYFCHRFVASYLHGSINMNDAVPGLSDLDYYVVVTHPLQETDEHWLHDTVEAVQRKYDVVRGVHIAVHTVEELKNDKFCRFMLAYNATLLAGEDIVEMLNASGYEYYEPDKNVAKDRLKFARKCFDDAMNHKQPACTGELPGNAYHVARKFARYFVVVEGAYYLMSQNKFMSFAKEDVLAQLSQTDGGFHNALELTRRVLENPVKAGVTHDAYLQEIYPLVIWMFNKVEES